LRLGARTWRISAPAAFRLTAERLPFVFHPQPEWEEFYFGGGVMQEVAPQIRPLGPAGQPWWPVADADAVRHGVHDILRTAERLHVPGTADLLDRLCELLILRSIPSCIPQPRMRHQRELAEIREQIDLNPRRDFAFDSTAGRLGITPGRFRDLWKRIVDRPPHAYLLRARIREACRLLLETDWSVKEVAQDVCFPDPYYFSRLFRQEMGCSPIAYRQRLLSFHQRAEASSTPAPT
jgi:AraC-like DNA-binding protein